MHPNFHPRSRQRGGMLSLLLTLVVIGLLAYFVLRANSGTTQGASQQQLVSCERLASDLIKRTGGLGPDYKTGYEALPPNCRGMLPPPAALEPKPPDSQGG